ncbi:hypothetical protein ACGFYY_32715 [Streptomyces sp. NPDC048331]|uniref:hypothetical protein n=1 Tax=Streptomyces sp. NPDC048331 TaxID=3365534 RepID=UPI0037204FA4
MALFARCPKPDPTPAYELLPQELYPETWTPEGLSVPWRFGNRHLSVTLVYASADDTRYPSYAVACLGCPYKASRALSGDRILRQDEAVELANSHASTCNALGNPVPERPDDESARTLLLKRLVELQQVRGARPINPEVFLGDRLELQRDDTWIRDVLLHTAEASPELLRAEPSPYAEGGFLFHGQPILGADTPTGA